MLWHRQVIFKSKGHSLSSTAECRIWTRFFEIKSPEDWMPTDKPTELSRIKLKLELNSPFLRSASTKPTRPHCHKAFAPRFGDIHVCCCYFRSSGTGNRFSNVNETSCLPLRNIWFEPGSLKTNLPQTECPLTNWLSYQGSNQTLNSIARPYEQRALSPLDPTATWLSHLALAIYMFVVVNFDALTQASDFQIERTPFVFHCWMQDLNQVLWNLMSSRLNTLSQLTELSRIKLKPELNGLPYDQRAFSPRDPTGVWLSHLTLAMYMFVVVTFDALAQASDF